MPKYDVANLEKLGLRVPERLRRFIEAGEAKAYNKTATIERQFFVLDGLKKYSLKFAAGELLDTRTYAATPPAIVPLAAIVEPTGSWLLHYVAVDASSPSCRVLLWEHLEKKFVTLAPSLDAFLAQFERVESKPKKPKKSKPPTTPG